MKSALPFFALVVIFASCTTAYKAGQTPDDVYYSPARPQHDEYVRVDDRQDKYRYDEVNEDDRYLRMKVRNRRTWSDLDYYYSDPYAFNYNYNRYNTYGSVYYNTPWNNYSSWNYYYNPYNSYYNPYGYNPRGSKVVVINQRPPVYNRPRTFNLNVYNPQPNNGSYNSKSSGRRVYSGDNRNFNYNTGSDTRTQNSNAGNSLRNTFGNNNSNSSSTQSTAPARSTNSSSSSSSTPSRSSTSAPVRKF